MLWPEVAGTTCLDKESFRRVRQMKPGGSRTFVSAMQTTKRPVLFMGFAAELVSLKAGRFAQRKALVLGG
jgi:hypothetical protein